MQFSSLGSLDEKWMAELSSSMSSGFSEDKTPLGIGEPLIVWPTVEDVRCSLEVLSSGLLVIIHYFLELYNNPILPNCKKSLSMLVYHLKFSFKWIIWHPLYLEPAWMALCNTIYYKDFFLDPLANLDCNSFSSVTNECRMEFNCFSLICLHPILILQICTSISMPINWSLHCIYLSTIFSRAMQLGMLFLAHRRMWIKIFWRSIGLNGRQATQAAGTILIYTCLLHIEKFGLEIAK